ncbi:uncharacterized protein TrAFT101_002389 [Trichoderma asperellum]|uniref:uncharacterized protein n=1 Tax=Trichoderma asperellum TaxID=101201 RepID=UPI003316F473|nr:hypothetical protein TrAFT101_002389 [Trichoderma asperellum]
MSALLGDFFLLHIIERLARAAKKRGCVLDDHAARGNFSSERRQPPNGGDDFSALVQNFGRQTEKQTVRLWRLLRHAIPIAATYDHKGLPIFDPLGRSTAVAMAETFHHITIWELRVARFVLQRHFGRARAAMER